MAKQYSPTQEIRDEGHTFAARIVTALGHTWHPRRVDYGHRRGSWPRWWAPGGAPWKHRDERPATELAPAGAEQHPCLGTTNE